MVDGAESTVAHAELAEVDGCYCVGFCRGVPCCGEEFFVGGDEVFGAGAHALGFDVNDHGPCRQQLGEGVHGFDEQRGERFHAFDVDSAGNLLKHGCGCRVVGFQSCGAAHDLGGDEQFAAGQQGEFGKLFSPTEGALVGDGEVAHFVEFVAEEFEADGGSCGGREDVDNAASYGVFAALGNQVYAGVCGIVEASYYVFEGVFFAANQVYGFKFFDAGDDGLDDGAYGCDNDLGAFICVPGHGAQYLQAAAYGVGAR